MTKLQVVPKQSGSGVQPLEPDAVLPATPTDNAFSETDSEKVLAAVVLGLLSNTYSGDVIWMSLTSAADMAVKAGVKQSEAERLITLIHARWYAGRKRNPLHELFE